MTLHKTLSKSAGSIGKIVSESKKNMTLNSDFGISHYREEEPKITPKVKEEKPKGPVDNDFLKYR